MSRLFRTGSVAAAAVAIATALVTSPVSPAEAAVAKPAYLLGIGCGSGSHCQAVGGASSGDAAIIGTTSGGSRWRGETAPAGVTFPDKLVTRLVACTDATHCIAIGTKQRSGIDHAVIIRTANGGSRWTMSTLPASFTSGSGLWSVDCPTSRRCYALGATGAGKVVLLRSGNRGSTWTAKALPRSFKPVGGAAMSCATGSKCQVVGSGMDSNGNSRALAIRTATRGQSWRTDKLPSGVSSLGSISCGTASACQALGMRNSHLSAFGSTDGGASWRVESLPSAADGYSTVRCGSGSHCVAVLQSQGKTLVARTATSGRSWHTGKLSRGNYLTDVDCASGRVCEGVGSNAHGVRTYRTTDGGRSWSVQKV